MLKRVRINHSRGHDRGDWCRRDHDRNGSRNMGRSRTQANVHDVFSAGLDVLELVTVGRDSVREQLRQTSVNEGTNSVSL